MHFFWKMAQGFCAIRNEIGNVPRIEQFFEGNVTPSRVFSYRNELVLGLFVRTRALRALVRTNSPRNSFISIGKDPPRSDVSSTNEILVTCKN